MTRSRRPEDTGHSLGSRERPQTSMRSKTGRLTRGIILSRTLRQTHTLSSTRHQNQRPNPRKSLAPAPSRSEMKKTRLISSRDSKTERLLTLCQTPQSMSHTSYCSKRAGRPSSSHLSRNLVISSCSEWSPMSTETPLQLSR